MEALSLIACVAKGSMRDALSLLDQAIGYGGGQVTTAHVRMMLGSTDQQNLFALLNALLLRDGQVLIEKAREICSYSVDIAFIIGDLLHLLQQLALYKIAPSTVDEIGDLEEFQTLANQMSPEDIQLFYQIALIGSRDLAHVPDPRTAFEMLLLRMLCFHPINEDFTPQIFAQTKSTKAEITALIPPLEQKSIDSSLPNHDDWPKLAIRLKLTAVARQLAENCTLDRCENDTLYLQLAPNMANLHNKRAEDRLQQALSEHYGRSMRLVIQIAESATTVDTAAIRRNKEHTAQQQAAAESIQNDTNVKALCETLNARLLPNSIRPLEIK